MLNYWRQSVEDGDRLDFNEKDIEKDAVQLPLEEIQAGELSHSSFEKVEKSADWGKKTALELMICPFPLFQKKKGEKNDVRLFPLVIPASLEEYGSLHPQKDHPPFIPRKYLEPNEPSSEAVGQLAVAEKFRDKHPHSQEGTWEMVWRDAEQLFKAVTGKKPERFELRAFQPDSKPFVWFGKTASFAYWHIASSYENLSRQTELPQLFETVTGANQKKQTYLSDHHKYGVRHYGQMTDQHPLTESQREALHHFLALDEGNVLGVNGPPGTGKTTLLQSVVSSLWIQRALEEGEPPVILAASSNNLAVLNILDSFKKAGASKPEAEDLRPLASRWLSGVDSYGLFCASKTQFDKKQDKYPCIKRDYNQSRNRSEWAGFHPDLEKGNKQRETDDFLNECTQFFEEPITELSQARSRLHQELAFTCTTIEERVIHFDERQRLQHRLKEEFQTKEGLEEALSEITAKEEKACENHRRWSGIYSDWLDEVNQRSIWRRLFSFLQGSANESFLRKKQVDESFSTYKDTDVKVVLSRKDSEAKQEQEYHQQRLHELKDFRDRLTELEAEWEAWTKDYESPEKDFFHELDTYWRYRAFLLATHYWEARWLEDLQAEDRPSVEHDETIWRRYAKLTPCLVATMLSAPNFFRRLRKANEYLYSFIDLLIVDEAGQVTPEQAGPVFALADQALVVGDTEQLQPIPRVHAQVDITNLKTCGLITDEEAFDRYCDNGMAASNGSVMKIAQHVSQFGKPDYLGGMLLTEHFRCAEDIIQYCNTLCYDNQLVPCRKNPIPGKELYGDLPRLGFLHIEGIAEHTGGSWENHREAATIAWWIYQMKDEWTKQGQRRLEDIIAVVSPYRKQAILIRRYLKDEYDIQGLTVNTVHSLQGAEKDIVLFAATLGGEVERIPFYDTTRFLLNVAVSRAKESFLVFGDMNSFGKAQRKPSGQLKPHLNPMPESRANIPEKEIESMVAKMKKKMGREKKMTKNYNINTTINNNNNSTINNGTITNIHGDQINNTYNGHSEELGRLIQQLREVMADIDKVPESQKKETYAMLEDVRRGEKKSFKGKVLKRLDSWQGLCGATSAVGQVISLVMDAVK
ncbi:DEAD/DEAH box helicase [Salinithrix halophila]|uniref:DEAD/DEAH box helicase n=1 Tax=Salinithrix halophila TaxID=1485204 RepID=A0ABV8JCZ2_9BACL